MRLMWQGWRRRSRCWEPYTAGSVGGRDTVIGLRGQNDVWRDGRMLQRCGSWEGLSMEKVDLVRAKGLVSDAGLELGSAVACGRPALRVKG